jgi:hypothetical protein
MDIIYILIGFICGFLCRQVVWLEQKRQSRIRLIKETKEFREQMVKIKAELDKQIKELKK